MITQANKLIVGDCLEVMRTMPDNSVDLVLTSPPYEAARTYGIGFKMRGQEWVDWAVERYAECVRVCRGLIVWIVEGQTRNFQYTATPSLLMADLHRKGIKLRKPAVFHRVGIPGSGGPDWLRNDWEFCVCASQGRLPWSDNTAMGHPPRYAPGGAMSNRHADGTRKNSRDKPETKERRVNQWGHSKSTGGTQLVNGKDRPSYRETKQYDGVTKANPGNVIKCKVGGGLMGSKLAHENEAPFPESLAEFFIRSFCPPEGVVLDPFCGSGTTCAVAKKNGRQWYGIDIRESQIELTERRLALIDNTKLLEQVKQN